jgi:maltose/maltodextrin transport system permease protein
MSALARLMKWPLAALLIFAALYLVFTIYSAGQPIFALVMLAFFTTGFIIYLSNIAFAYRYLFPGLAGMAVFVAFPLFYTAHIGLTNYSSKNLLSQERATQYLLDQVEPDQARAMTYTLHAEGDEYRIIVMPFQDSSEWMDSKRLQALRAQSFISPSLALRSASPPEQIQMLPLQQGSFEPNEPLPMLDVLQRRAVLQKLQLQMPNGDVLSYAGVREFSPVNALWKAGDDGSITRVQDGMVYTPNLDTGFFVNNTGEIMQPGFKVNIGFDNYTRMLTNPEYRGPFLSIFLWTVTFAGLTVLFCTVIGMSLAVMLNWEALRFRTIYRTLLFLPYAVPGFISILVFKGLFNQNFGEINAILNGLFGIKPAWFADPFLAKVMLLIVNTWLGYPFVMVLCSGLLKSIPADLYEASAIAGAGPFTNFFKITAPLIIKPLMPLLISAFAFNFNNFVLIALLTDGRPDFLNTKIPAGTTDILVSYTYRIAFQDSGQNFGLAAAISTMIFILVALMSLLNLKLTGVNKEAK